MAITSRTVWRSLRWNLVVIPLLLLFYSASYAVLYHRGVAEAEKYGYDYFFYAPIADVVQDRNETNQHVYLGPIYDPINHVHYRWFGGRAACKCLLRGLSL